MTVPLGLSELHQIDRWFQAAKDAADRGDARGAWGWANQGQIYTRSLIRKEEEAPEKGTGEAGR